MCELLRKKKVNTCCLQVFWRGNRTQFVGGKSTRFKLWWSGINDRTRCWYFGERIMPDDYRSLKTVTE